jgi:hypothetical protein
MTGLQGNSSQKSAFGDTPGQGNTERASQWTAGAALPFAATKHLSVSMGNDWTAAPALAMIRYAT